MLTSLEHAMKFAGATALALALAACHESDRPTRFDPVPPRSSGAETPASSQVRPVVSGRAAEGTDKVTTVGTSVRDSDVREEDRSLR
jgi:hypothetical protein